MSSGETKKRDFWETFHHIFKFVSRYFDLWRDMSATSFSDYADCFKALPDDFRIKILLDNGLLIQRKNAVWNIYSLNQKHFFFPVLDKLFAARKKKMRGLSDPSKGHSART